MPKKCEIRGASRLLVGEGGSPGPRPSYGDHDDHELRLPERQSPCADDPTPPDDVRPQAGPVPLPAVSSPTWKGGWVASGLAVVVSVTALSVVGVFAFDALTQPDPAPAASLLAPAAPPSTATDVAPAPVLPAPTVTATPATRVPAPVALAPRVIVVPRPTAAPAPAPHHNPVVVPVAPAPHPDPVVVPVIPV